MQLAGAAEVNKHYLKLVDTALFVLCLDHTSPSTAAEVSYLVLLLTSLLKQWLSECVCVRWKVFGFDTHITMVWCNLYVRTYIHILVITSSFCLPFPSRRLGCVFLPILYVRTYVRMSFFFIFIPPREGYVPMVMCTLCNSRTFTVFYFEGGRSVCPDVEALSY